MCRWCSRRRREEERRAAALARWRRLVLTIRRIRRLRRIFGHLGQFLQQHGWSRLGWDRYDHGKPK